MIVRASGGDSDEGIISKSNGGRNNVMEVASCFK